MTKSLPNVQKKVYPCEFCGKEFAQNAGRCRHQKHRCPLRTGHSTKNADTVDDNTVAIDFSKQTVALMKDSVGINQLAKAVAKEIIKSGSMNIQTQNIQNQNNIQNQTNNVTIYVNEKVDFIEILTQKFGGDEAKAISYLKEKISRNLVGDIELFCDIYLVGKKKEDWPLIMTDKKNKIFLLKNRKTGSFITDTGGHLIYQKFKDNYMDALLKISNLELNKVLGKNVESPDYEEHRDYLLDVFDLRCMQDKLYGLTKLDPKTFINKLSTRIKELEDENKLNIF